MNKNESLNPKRTLQIQPGFQKIKGDSLTEEPHNTQNDKGPVFIVGMNGSGTTMLLDSLSHHPDLYVFPRETRILPYFISKSSSYGDLSTLSARRKLAADLGKSFPFWQENKKKPVILKDSALKNPTFSGVVDSIMRYFADSKGKTVCWVEKSPMYIQHIDLLAKYFSDARFIHMYRDGRDIAQSLHRRWKRDPRWTIYRWKNIVQLGRSQGQSLEASRYIEIRYEDLTSNPERHMKKICTFLGVKYSVLLLKSSMREMDPNIKSGFIVPNSGKWKTYFTEKQIHEVESIAGRFLQELGYKIADVQGSEDPWKLYLLWWRLYDYLRLTISNYKTYGISSTPTFIRKVQSALRQFQTNYY